MDHDVSVDTVWDELRSTRWRPPAAALANKGRRATYVFALEQAEQMFRAAAVVGTATRPLQLFYGLNQAGRAIAAASPAEEWQLKGHGIAPANLADDLPSVGVRTDLLGSSGSFVRLSELLGSPLWGKTPVALNELWDSLPENEQAPLLDRGTARRTPLHVEYRNMSREPHPLASVPVVGFPPWLVDGAADRKMLDDYLSAFAGARDYHDFVHLGREVKSPNFSQHDDGWGELTMHWQIPGGLAAPRAERLALLESLTRRYGGSMIFFPTVGANEKTMHPLMAWWAILHSLSMLARYQPAEWAAHINVDTSSYAVHIERFLRQALRVVPRLVLETIGQVST
jgi:hypothetical protein